VKAYYYYYYYHNSIQHRNRRFAAFPFPLFLGQGKAGAKGNISVIQREVCRREFFFYFWV
jgi:hypothetical protein